MCLSRNKIRQVDKWLASGGIMLGDTIFLLFVRSQLIHGEVPQ